GVFGACAVAEASAARGAAVQRAENFRTRCTETTAGVVGEGGVSGLDTGIQNRRHHALTIHADAAGNAAAIPDVVGPDEGRTAVGIQLVLALALNVGNTRHRAEALDLGVGQTQSHATVGDQVVVGRIDTAA